MAEHAAAESGSPAVLELPSAEQEPAWEQPASGIYCTLLATDDKRG